MKKRIMALVICLAIVLTCVPYSAFAEGTVIDTVPITIADPVAGEYPTYMSSMLEGKNYTVYEENWINNTDGFVDLRPKETFELGKEYIYSVWFKPNEGYSFDYAAVATISNPDWTIVDLIVSGEGMLHFQANYTVTTGENKVVPDEEKIKETLNLNLGTFNSQPGEYPTIINSTVDCDRYYVYYERWYNITDDVSMTSLDGDKRVAKGTFETGKLYTYTLYIKPYDVYGFTDDSQVLIDGIEWNMSSMWVEHEAGYDNFLIFTGYYTPGLEPIDNVTLNIESVEAGKPLVFVNDIPEDANYTIDKQVWYKDGGEEIPQDSIYDTMGVYDYNIYLVPKEGYRFTSDTTGTVNGVEWEEYSGFFTADGQSYGDCKYGVFFGKCTAYEKETEAETEETTSEVTTEATASEATTEVTTEATISANDDASDTGLGSGPTLWISLLCIAVAGIVVTVVVVRVKNKSK